MVNVKGLRGQSAMEYLMTYGWALLVIVVVIAVLAWIMTLNKLDQCIFDPGFQCTGQRLIGNYTESPGITSQSVLFASVTSGQKSRISVRGVACISGNSKPPAGYDWYNHTYFRTDFDLDSTGSFNLGNVTFISGITRTRCYQAFPSSTGSTPVVSLNTGNKDFSGTIYIAYKFADEDAGIPPKVATGRITTRSQ